MKNVEEVWVLGKNDLWQTVNKKSIAPTKPPRIIYLSISFSSRNLFSPSSIFAPSYRSIVPHVSTISAFGKGFVLSMWRHTA